MFQDFLAQLIPIYEIDNEEWQETLRLYENRFQLNEPNLFWYLSSGIDLKALIHFNSKDTREVYKTPNVDIFIYSDYGGITKILDKFYQELDTDSILLHKDFFTCITLEQMIPLQYFSETQIIDINKKYCHNKPSWFDKDWISNSFHFYYCLIEVESNYFGNEIFPLLISPIDNWILMEEVWKKDAVLFDYICGICDGCRKGGAYKCVNIHYKDFLSLMKKTRRFWISDHIHWERLPSYNDFKNEFREIAVLRGWGPYNKHIIYKKKCMIDTE